VDMLPNDSDPDGDTLTLVSATSDAGEVTILPDGRVVFMPSRGFFGNAVVTYTISDGQGGFSTAQIIISVPPEDNHVEPQNRLPGPDDQPRSRFTGDPLAGGLSVLMAAAGEDQSGLRDPFGRTDDIFRRFLETRSFKDSLAGDTLRTRSFLGASDGLVIGEVEGGRKLWVETMRHEGSFVLKVYETAPNGRVTMVEHSLRSAGDIGWLDRLGKDIHMGLPPAHLDSVEVEVEAVLSTGEVVKRKVVIDPTLGQVRAQRETVLMKLY
jgi:hypothetical protein